MFQKIQGKTREDIGNYNRVVKRRSLGIFPLFICLSLLFTGLWIVPSEAIVERVSMVKDSNTLSAGSFPNYIKGGDNNKLCFTAYTPFTGSELWCSDGTAEGTKMVKDICNGWIPSFLSNDPQFLFVDDTCYFILDDRYHGNELWRTDGTEEGTYMVIDLAPGEDSGVDHISDDGLNIFLDPSEGNGMWITDGTEAGTMQIPEINFYHSGTHNFIRFQDRTYFLGYYETGPTTIFRTDGTPDGTYPLIQTTEGAPFFRVHDFSTTDNYLFFTASNEENFTEIWFSNGTEEGISKIIGLPPDVDGSITTVRDFCYFTTSEETQLWKTDGTSTILLLDLRTIGKIHVNSRSTINTGNKLYFLADDGVHGLELWVSDGTEESTHLVKDIFPGNDSCSSYLYEIKAVSDIVFFAASDGDHGDELWCSDGTELGTYMIKDINEDTKLHYGNSYPRWLTVIDNHLYFSAMDSNSEYELWISDGTEEGTRQLTDINHSTQNGCYCILNGHFPGQKIVDHTHAPVSDFLHLLTQVKDLGYYPCNLCIYDGNELGETLASGFRTQYVSYILGNTENGIVFSGQHEEFGFELWVSDTTLEGTFLLKDIYPGLQQSSFPRWPIEFQGKIFFSARNADYGEELWVTDGTTEGTYIFKDLNPYGSSSPSSFTTIDDYFLFFADDGVNGTQLWTCDGTPSGTEMLKVIAPGGKSGIYGDCCAHLGNKVIFGVQIYEEDIEPWITDGTAEGTNILKDINPSGFSYAEEFFPFKDKVYFIARENETIDLWCTDGTNEGTYVVRRQFPDFRFRKILCEVDERILGYSQKEGTGGTYYLWSSDGTETGTNLITEDVSFYPSGFFSSGKIMYFPGYNTVNGLELWRTDGTTEGTYMVCDVASGDMSSIPRDLCEYEGDIYFTADDGIHGRELWKLEILNGPSDLIDDLIKSVTDLDVVVFDDADHQEDMISKLEAVEGMVERGEYQGAIKKLTHDIIKLTDGCIINGYPDKQDWIQDCEVQQELYEKITHLIESIQEDK